jgi:hypothetical protein
LFVLCWQAFQDGYILLIEEGLNIQISGTLISFPHFDVLEGRFAKEVMSALDVIANFCLQRFVQYCLFEKNCAGI